MNKPDFTKHGYPFVKERQKPDMNIRTAALQMVPLIRQASLPEEHGEYGKDHLGDMVRKIDREQVTGEKAHRWLGYIQGVLVSSGSATLDQVKEANKAA